MTRDPDLKFIGWQPRWEGRRPRFERLYAPRLTHALPVVNADLITALVSPAPSGSPLLLQVTLTPQVMTTNTRGVVRTRRDTSHTFHLLMTIITGGMWGIVWLVMTIWHQVGPRRRSKIKTRTTVESR